MSLFNFGLFVGNEAGDRFSFHFLKWFIPLPFKLKKDIPEQICLQWGVGYLDREISFRWGERYKSISMPWYHGSCVYSKVRDWCGEWIDDKGRDYSVKPQSRSKFNDRRKVYTYPYRYVLTDGEVQSRTAIFYEGKMIWTWKIFHWIPNRFLCVVPFKLTRRCISVEWSDAIGEDTDSWKGGVTGTGFKMLPGEIPMQTIQRMERTYRIGGRHGG